MIDHIYHDPARAAAAAELLANPRGLTWVDSSDSDSDSGDDDGAVLAEETTPRALRAAAHFPAADRD